MTSAPRRRLLLYAAAGAFALTFLVDLLTLAPTVGPIDSGELTLAAWLPGVAHPPGFPIYILIGYLFSRLPIGSVAVRLNLMSDFFAALSAAALCALVWSSGQTPEERAHGDPASSRRVAPGSPAGGKTAPAERRSGSASPRPARRDLHSRLAAAGQEPMPALAAAVAAALAWAFSRSLWSYSTVAEVYTLHLALLTGSLVFLFRWRNANQAAHSADRNRRDLYWAAFLYGLSLSDHHVTSVLIAPAILLLLVLTAGRRLLAGRTVLYAALALVAGLLPYVYLPLRAAQHPVLNWGDPQDFTRLWWHLTAKWAAQYDRVANLPEFFRLLYDRFTRLWVVEFGFLGLPLAAVGAFFLWRRDRALLALLAVAMIASVIYGTLFGTTEPAAYFLATFLFTAWLIGQGVRGLFALGADRRLRAGAIAVACAVPLLALALNYRAEDRRRQWLVQDYAEDTLAGIAPGGVLLSMDWEVQIPALLYLHHVEGKRPDVLIIDTQLLRRSWYYGYLQAEAPSLYAAARPRIDVFRAELDRFERDQPFDPQAIQSSFEAMVNALVEQAAAAGRPVYLGPDVDVGIAGGPGRTVVAPDRQRVPEGLSFRLSADRDAQAGPVPRFRLRGLIGEKPASSPLAVQVRTRYGRMLMSRGLYLAQLGRHEDAVAAFRTAIELDRSLVAAYQELGKSLEALGRSVEASEVYSQARRLSGR